ncbi:MAG: LysM peptidoglycan-binding domain-containing protein, partial [Gammaproteobacteria bacterium]|nr:LysM peptidoglycan-binding domain-containing protein [Gammaproteobacteria bacterium]
MSTYSVKQGDCIASIAEQYGMLPDTIWQHADNSDLRKLRKNPNILYPGDTVVIPDKTLAQIDAATDSKHSFVCKKGRAKNKIQILLNGEPLANKDYEVQFDGEWGDSGTTDGEGFIEQNILPRYKKAKVTITEGNNTQIFNFSLGSLDPI